MWAFTKVSQDSVLLNDLLKQGWEPFAADHEAADSSGDAILLRMKVDGPSEAGTIYFHDDE